MREEVLRVENLTHRVNGVEVLSHFNLNIFSGEIMGLLPLDSHGKSELVRLICENIPVHYGRIYYGGRLVNNHGGRALTRNNVAVIDKERRLVDDLTAADNIFVLRNGYKKSVINRRTLCRQLEIYAREFSVDLDGEKTIRQMSEFERRATELIRAKVSVAKLLIAEDIGNIISAGDLPRFQDMLRRYTSDGSSVLYICSHHEEILRICDRVTLMEGGRVICVMDRDSFNEDIIWRRSLDFTRFNFIPASAGAAGSALIFDGVTAGKLKDLSFSVGEGECLALLDLNDSVIDDIMGLISGEKAPEAGGVFLDGMRPETLAGKPGVVEFIPDEPLKKTLFPEFSYLENLCYPLGQRKSFIWRGKRFRKSICADYERFVGRDIYETDISRLSVESLYKLVYYRIHLANPRLAVCLQPFFGSDMYLRHTIIEMIKRLLERGITVLIMLTNISDSLLVADRMLVLRDGRLLREYGHGELGRFADKSYDDEPVQGLH